MGVLGNWITNQTAKPFFEGRSVFIHKPITHAEAKVCGLGQFHFYINGCKVENHELDPGDGLMPSQCPYYIPNVLPVPGMGSFYDIIGGEVPVCLELTGITGSMEIRGSLKKIMMRG